MSRKNTIIAFVVFSVWITFLFLCSLTGVGYTSWLMQKLGLLAATSETKKEIAIALSCIIGVSSIMLLKTEKGTCFLLLIICLDGFGGFAAMPFTDYSPELWIRIYNFLKQTDKLVFNGYCSYGINLIGSFFVGIWDCKGKLMYILVHSLLISFSGITLKLHLQEKAKTRRDMNGL